MKAITIDDNKSYLRQISVPVDINDSNLQNDIKVLATFCEENNILAMAAIQLGIPKRMIYLKNTNLEIVKRMQTDDETTDDKNHNEAKILINPVIIERKGLTEYWEACASCLDNMGLVKRPYKITLKYQDINGNSYCDVFEGFESTVLSHEMDHLDGILHIDVAEKVLVMSLEERKKFRQTHDYKIFNKDEEYVRPVPKLQLIKQYN